MPPIDKLLELNAEALRLELLQELIHTERAIAPHDQQVQLEMDRMQTVVDTQLAAVTLQRIAIATSN